MSVLLPALAVHACFPVAIAILAYNATKSAIVLFATTVAIWTTDPQRRDVCLEIVRIAYRRTPPR